MLYRPVLIPKIIRKEKTETRRLVREYERFNTRPGRGPVGAIVNDETQRTRFEIGKNYAVQPGRGKPGIYYKLLPMNCYSFFDFSGVASSNIESVRKDAIDSGHEPLRILINDIKKEKLQEITEAGAKREGFESKREFLEYFYHLTGYLKKEETLASKLLEDRELHMPNPEVWVLIFEVVK